MTHALEGKPLTITYDNGLRLEAEVLDGGRLQWHALSGPAQGSSAIEEVSAAEVADGVHFLSWIEGSGTTVSLVLNTGTMAATSFVTFDAGGKRQGMLQTGTFAFTER